VLWIPFPILGPFIFGNKDGEDVEVTEYGYGMAEEETDKKWQHLVLTGCSD